MTAISKLINQSSHYFAGQIALMLAGFISFPVLTRILTVEEYGVMSLITTTLFIGTSVVKLGLPNAIVRFYSDFKQNDIDKYYFTNIFSGLLAASIASAILLISLYVMSLYYENKELYATGKYVVFLFFSGSLADILQCFLRAEQKTKLYNFTNIVRKYGILAIGIYFAYVSSNKLSGYYIGQAVASFMMMILLYVLLKKKITLSPKYFSKQILTAFIAFGFPLIWVEFGHLLLNYADRYLIQLFLGPKQLGIYTAGYNLCTYVSDIIIYPINYAMIPIYMKILTEKGEEETKKFFTMTFTYYMLVVLPVAFGFIATAKTIISLLATDKYTEANSIMIYIILGQVVYASSIILNSGLFINKKTIVVTRLMVIACCLKIILNIFMIRKFGIVGAAISTLIVSIFYTAMITRESFMEFKFNIEFKKIFTYLVASLVMMITVINIQFDKLFYEITAKVVSGILLYSLLILVLDSDLRHKVLKYSAIKENS